MSQSTLEAAYARRAEARRVLARAASAVERANSVAADAQRILDQATMCDEAETARSHDTLKSGTAPGRCRAAPSGPRAAAQ